MPHKVSRIFVKKKSLVLSVDNNLALYNTVVVFYKWDVDGYDMKQADSTACTR